MKKLKLLKRALAGSRNFQFDELVTLVEAFGFRRSRTQGSHQIFTHPGIPELLNLQNVNGEAKPYQIRQFLTLLQKYHLEPKE